MNWLVSIIARLSDLNPPVAAREASRSAAVLAGAGLLFVTFWITAIVGAILLLGHWIGLVPAVFIVSGVSLLFGFGLLIWFQSHARTRREVQRARIEARQSAITSVLAALPNKNARRAVIVVSAIAALATLASKPRQDQDDEA